MNISQCSTPVTGYTGEINLKKKRYRFYGYTCCNLQVPLGLGARILICGKDIMIVHFSISTDVKWFKLTFSIFQECYNFFFKSHIFLDKLKGVSMRKVIFHSVASLSCWLNPQLHHDPISRGPLHEKRSSNKPELKARNCISPLVTVVQKAWVTNGIDGTITQKVGYNA